MRKTWIDIHNISVPENFLNSIGGNPLVSQILYQRGITDPDTARGFLIPDFYHPTSALDLPGMEKITGILQNAIHGKKKIGIWGDFDVDGQTATTLFVTGLRNLGGNVIFHIPHRSSESHGIGTQALQKFLDQGIDILLSCDTGISSHKAIEYAHTRGVPVLVTDHHDLPIKLPNAEVIINPKMLPAGHPLGTLPGVGVAHKTIEQLFAQFDKTEKSSQYLDLVALGIVADVAIQKGDTRYLLQRGLETLRSTQRLGLLSMLELAEVNQANLTEEHIGFIIAPRMNALGRLDDANLIVEFLTTSNISRARILALELERMNAQRKLLCDQVYQAAQSQLSLDPKMLDYPILILSHPSWPAGVIGIVAARLVEQYHRPVILFSAPAGLDARGSARSIDSVNITSIIAANRELVKDFGGHPFAAGLSIDPLRIAEFREATSRTLQSMGIEIQKEKNLIIDGYLELPELTLDLVVDLERLAPFGAGNPSLVLASRNLQLTGYSAIGRNNEHLQLTIEDEMGHTQRSIWWHGAGNALPDNHFDLAYSVRASTFRGQHEVQVEWVDFHQIERSEVSVESMKPSIEVIDLRQEFKSETKLSHIQHLESLVIWGEAEKNSRITCLDRYSLNPSDNLAIWTIPPGLIELQAAILRVKPRKVYFFANDPGMDNPKSFLERLLGLIKYRIKHSQGSTTISYLATATAQKTSTTKLGLEWLIAKGYITIKSITDDKILVENAGNRISNDERVIATLLNSALSESAAFRRYYLKADPNRLLLFMNDRL